MVLRRTPVDVLRAQRDHAYPSLDHLRKRLNAATRLFFYLETVIVGSLQLDLGQVALDPAKQLFRR